MFYDSLQLIVCDGSNKSVTSSNLETLTSQSSFFSLFNKLYMQLAFCCLFVFIFFFFLQNSRLDEMKVNI